MSKLLVASQRHTQFDGGVRRAVLYRQVRGEESEVWWDIEGAEQDLPGPPQNDDLALVSLIFYAMRRGVDFHINGRVSATLIQRLERFIQIWSLWRPDLYKQVQISVDEELPDRVPSAERDRLAICAYSGGVDASCSVLTHARGRGGRGNRRLLAGVLIQGFDIGLENQAAFTLAKGAAQVALDDLGIPLATVRSNWKVQICGDWHMEFGLGVFCCLKPWEDRVGSLLVGSCEDYSRLVTPWGSHPLPTQLLSSRDTDLVYDGGELNRTQKIGLLSDWQVGYNNLRVCWEGDITGKNCGACEKCIRTKLNAVVSGKKLPASLLGLPTPTQVSRIGPLNEAQRALFYEIIDEASKNGYSGPLLKAVKLAVDRRRLPLRRKIKQSAARLFGSDRLG